MLCVCKGRDKAHELNSSAQSSPIRDPKMGAEHGGFRVGAQVEILSFFQDAFDHDKGQKSVILGRPSPLDFFEFSAVDFVPFFQV